ncbi:MAG TPA: flagellar motor protein MotB [Terriglobia bacterium]|jgi:chemotaxis protein MotB
MVRRKKPAERVNHERWIVSYADFITLLFAFFVVLFAASNSDQKKTGQVANAVQVAFKQMGVFSPSGKVVPLYDDGVLPADTKTIIGNDHGVLDAAQFIATGKPDEPGRKDLADIRSQLEVKLKEELASRSVRMSENSRGLTISLAETGFFDPGSAVMPANGLAAIDRIASTLRPMNFSVRVEGHTDNTPIHTAQFPSNWELSTRRATFLLQYLISTGSIPPERLSAAGYAEYRPVASNDTPEGRAANRRVDLVVLGAGSLKLEPQTPPAAVK